MKKKLLFSCVVLAASVVSVDAQILKELSIKSSEKASSAALLESQVEFESKQIVDKAFATRCSEIKVPKKKIPFMNAESRADGQTTPMPSYRQPSGSYFYGLSENGYAYNSVRLITNLNRTIKFVNTSPGTTSSFEWTGFDLEQNPFKSTNTHMVFPTEMGEYYYMPHLKETVAGKDSTFILGQMANSQKFRSIFETSAFTEKDPDGGKFGLTNANIDYGTMTWRFVENEYCFGTGNGMQDALLAVFDKPMGRLYFEGVKIYAGTFEAPPATEFTLRVVTFTVDPKLGIVPKDTLATSVITAADVKKPYFFTFTFDKFFALDADGFESEVSFIETDEPFMLEFSGFNAPGVKLGIVSEYVTDPDPLASSFFYAYDENKERKIYSWTGIQNTMLFNLVDAIIGYIISDVDEILADVNGSSHEFKIMPMFTKFWLDEELPSWMKLSSDDSNLSTLGYATVKLDIEPLQTKAAGRQAFIKLGTWGAQVTIPVTQGDVLGTDIAKAEIVTAYFQGENLLMSYPEGMKNVSVYSLNGALVASYMLDSDGTTQVSAAELAKGVYVLKFEGNNEASCKVIK